MYISWIAAIPRKMTPDMHLTSFELVPWQVTSTNPRDRDGFAVRLFEHASAKTCREVQKLAGTVANDIS